MYIIANNLLYVFVFITILSISCHGTEPATIRTDVNQNRIAKLQYDSMQAEIKLYLKHAKYCKTEYEVVSYRDSLPLTKQATIKEFGSEQNWHSHLEWLKTHGSQKVTISPSVIPIFDREERSPYNGH